jgi:hypothetical protein
MPRSFSEIKGELLADWLTVREAHAQCHIHVLLDDACPVAIDHPLHDRSLQSRPVVRHRMRVGGDPVDPAQDWRPIALQLYEPGDNGYPDESLIELSVECALERAASINGAYVAAWVATEQPVASFAAHLERCTHVFDMHAGRRRKLPFYQPHRMELLTAEQEPPPASTALLQGVYRWSFLDASGELRSVVAPTQPPGVSMPPALRIGKTQGAMQSRVSLARRVLLGLREADIDVPANPAITIDRFLRWGVEMGLRDAEDLIFFVLNCVSMSPLWHQHPAAQAAIRTSVKDQVPLAGVLDELDDPTLEAMAAQGAPGEQQHNVSNKPRTESQVNK